MAEDLSTIRNIRHDEVMDLLERRGYRIMTYLWVVVGSALGGLARYSLTRWTLGWSSSFPWGTILINVVGALVIGFFGSFTLASGRFAVSENTRLFAMVGLCGGFTTFSSFSLQTFDLIRSGAWGKALANVLLSVVLCLAAVTVGHLLAQQSVSWAAIAQTQEDEKAHYSE